MCIIESVDCKCFRNIPYTPRLCRPSEALPFFLFLRKHVFDHHTIVAIQHVLRCRWGEKLYIPTGPVWQVVCIQGARAELVATEGRRTMRNEMKSSAS